MRRKTNTEMQKMNQTFYQFRRWLCVPLAALCLLGLLAWYMQHTTQIADGSNLTSVQGIPSHVSVRRLPRSPVQVRFTLSGQKYTYIPRGADGRNLNKCVEALEQADEATVTTVSDWSLRRRKSALVIETSQGTFGSIEKYNAYLRSQRVAGWIVVGSFAAASVFFLGLPLLIMYLQPRPKELRSFRGFLRCLFSSRRRKRKHTR